MILILTQVMKHLNFEIGDLGKLLEVLLRRCKRGVLPPVLNILIDILVTT